MRAYALPLLVGLALITNACGSDGQAGDAGRDGGDASGKGGGGGKGGADGGAGHGGDGGSVGGSTGGSTVGTGGSTAGTGGPTAGTGGSTAGTGGSRGRAALRGHGWFDDGHRRFSGNGWLDRTAMVARRHRRFRSGHRRRAAGTGGSRQRAPAARTGGTGGSTGTGGAPPGPAVQCGHGRPSACTAGAAERTSGTAVRTGGATGTGGTAGATGGSAGGSTGTGGATGTAGTGGGVGAAPARAPAPAAPTPSASTRPASTMSAVSTSPQRTRRSPVRRRATASRNVCDGIGGLMVAILDSDAPADDGNACTAETCVNGLRRARQSPRGPPARRPAVRVQRQPVGRPRRLRGSRPIVPDQTPPVTTRLREPEHVRARERTAGTSAGAVAAGNCRKAWPFAACPLRRPT